MADRWQTYPIEFKGGLITNLSPLQQGINAPGSARILRNYEPSIEGGYRRIEGFSKYDSNQIPPYGSPVVHGASQTGTTLVIGNIHTTPVVGDTLTITGVSGTYTIASGGVTYDSTNNRATLTLTSSLNSSPANAAAVTFATTTNKYLINGIASWEDSAIVAINDDIFKTSGSGTTHINIPNYGTVLVNGASQTGTSLIVDGLTSAPQAGDVFKINSVDLVYTVTADASVSSGGATLSINPSLASSPADDAAITFLSTSRDGAVKTRFAKYNFSGTEKIAIVDGANAPALYNSSVFTVLDSAPAEVISASHVTDFKKSLFFAKGSTVTFTAPYTDNDFSVATGGGSINVGSTVTGLIVFREQLIIFTETNIQQLVGNSVADYRLQPIASDIGCLEGDTIKEIGGDVMFLGPDGLRMLSATERIGDFGLASVSKIIQDNMTNFIRDNTSFISVVIREKSQYRLLGFNTNYTQENAQGIIATQFAEQGGANMGFSETRGIKAHAADSNYNGKTEVVLFANDDRYVYQMESGNSFDGSNISTTFATPHMPISDPRVRKTFYKMFLYTDPQGSVNFDTSLKLDFDAKDIIQPNSISFDNSDGQVGFYGTGFFGSTTYGGKLQKLFSSQVIGSGFSVSFQFNSDSTDPPFSLDALTVEYGTNDRR
tara:strand:- start:766 stop:2745 length:1980 start_codon:yes stop_codon:yes gene_type:complete